MKKLIIYLTLILSLSSCGFKTNKIYDYQDVENLKIQWNEVFNLAKVDYFVYIYSQTCYYCVNIKQEIITFALSDKYPTYFIEYTDDIEICYDISKTLLKDNIDEICILGTPTLLDIQNNCLMNNIVGGQKIINFLENY